MFVSCRGIGLHLNQALTLKSLKVSSTNCSLGGKSGMLYSKIKKRERETACWIGPRSTSEIPEGSLHSTAMLRTKEVNTPGNNCSVLKRIAEAYGQTAPFSILRCFGVLQMGFCPVTVPIPRFPCCISPQLPQQTGITWQGTDHSSDHFLKPPGLEMPTASGKSSFVISARVTPWFTHTSSAVWLCHWLRGCLVWGLSKQPQGLTLLGITSLPCCLPRVSLAGDTPGLDSSFSIWEVKMMTEPPQKLLGGWNKLFMTGFLGAINKYIL